MLGDPVPDPQEDNPSTTPQHELGEWKSASEMDLLSSNGAWLTHDGRYFDFRKDNETHDNIARKVFGIDGGAPSADKAGYIHITYISEGEPFVYIQDIGKTTEVQREALYEAVERNPEVLRHMSINLEDEVFRPSSLDELRERLEEYVDPPE